MNFNPWHSLSAGNNAPEIVTAVIEITQGSKAKYELDKESGLLRLDRILKTKLAYPAYYGFIPKTYCDDHDPLDIIIICSEPLLPGSLVDARIVGALKVVDNGEQDDKLLAVVNKDYVFDKVTDLASFPHDQLETIIHFFKNYKNEEHKVVTVEKTLDKKEAQQLVVEALELYKKTF